jgi:hypothetical protein
MPGKETTMDWKFVMPSLVAVAACTNLQTPVTAIDVPEKLRPDASESLEMIVHARGVQIYECRATKDRAGAYEWAFVAPEADLFDAKGTKVGRHFAGPSWEFPDGSTIVGTVKQGYDAPRADAIPWLLLATKSVGPRGALSGITAVQRINTVGGAAPKAGCSQADAGAAARMPYTADYYLLAARNYNRAGY